MAGETLMQPETAKKSVEALRADGMKAIEAYNSIASKLDQSRPCVNLLEGLVSKLEVDINKASRSLSQNCASDCELEQEIEENHMTRKSNQLEEELSTLKSEVGRLRYALEFSETKFHEEKIQSTVQIKSAHELMEEIKSRRSVREAELEAELEKMKYEIEELKTNLMDKETELQGVSEENEELRMKFEKNLSCRRESELGNNLRKLKEALSDLKANLMDKETELQNIFEENEMLKLEISKGVMDTHKANNGWTQN